MTTDSMIVIPTTACMTAPETKIEIIRKRLATAVPPAIPAETDAGNGKATELMAGHDVDSAVLAVTGMAFHTDARMIVTAGCPR